MGALKQRPEIMYAAIGFDPNYPQYVMNINVPEIKEADASVSDLLTTMQGFYGSICASNFNEFGKQYRVMVQADAPYQNKPASLNSIYINGKWSDGTDL